METASTAMAKTKKRVAFVTVGTTQFDALIQVRPLVRLPRKSGHFPLPLLPLSLPLPSRFQ